MPFTKINPQDFDAIILDFGGVLINIDYQVTSRSFAHLGLTQDVLLYSQSKQTLLFDDLETGRITPHTFRTEIRKIAGRNLSDDEIDEAWNAMILDFPASRIPFLKRLRALCPVYLLSNTNAIHHSCFSGNILLEYGLLLESLFDKVWYSHEMGMRKPLPETFRHVLKFHGLHPERTLFIDDSEQHVAGAKSLGIQAFLLPKAKDIEDIFYFTS